MTLDDNKEQSVLRLKGHLGLDSSPALLVISFWACCKDNHQKLSWLI